MSGSALFWFFENHSEASAQLSAAPPALQPTLFFHPSRWDDYGYRTTFTLWLWNEIESQFIGTVKIGEREMNASYTRSVSRTRMPEGMPFKALLPEFVSVGQDQSYYQNLIQLLGRDEAIRVLHALNDVVVANPDELDRTAQLPVGYRSLFRSVSPETVKDQFARIVAGESVRDEFTLEYAGDGATSPETRTSFIVRPQDRIPGTLQVVIGANGAGKTRMLQDLRASFDRSTAQERAASVELSDKRRLAGVVTVSFSMFDVLATSNVSDDMRTSIRDIGPDLLSSARTAEQQTEVFAEQVKACATAGRDAALHTALTHLVAVDTVLAEIAIMTIDRLALFDFGSLSSGHKIVLLTLAALVANCDDRTLVLIDEPEAHLHPPLLAAFLRALSDLVQRTNSLAIVATHSPVVLQQVPSRHARVAWRHGSRSGYRPLPIETLGENLGVLTAEVFRVDLDHSAHFDLLQRAAAGRTYEEALAWLGVEKLGSEAAIVLRALLSQTPQ